MFNSREYEFADLTLILGGKDITGVRGIKYTEKIEREALYGKGRYALAMQSGNVSIEGEITLLQSEMEALIQAGQGSLFNLALNAEVNYGNPSNGDALVTDRIEGIYFTESTKQFKQGDKFMEVTVPFVALRVQHQV
jgi:hypothetical protein